MYNKSFQVLWANIDANRHLRHSAYADFAAQVRLNYFHDHGFSTEEFVKLQIGAILFREETTYFKEIGMNELVKVDLFLAGSRKDGSRWRIIHHIFRSDGIKAATIEADGAWMDLVKRKLTNPPEQILNMLEHMPKTPNFDYWPDKTS
jgi:acyl-CoA thioester hydrolase